jgi:hypothetical protein
MKIARLMCLVLLVSGLAFGSVLSCSEGHNSLLGSPGIGGGVDSEGRFDGSAIDP